MSGIKQKNYLFCKSRGRKNIEEIMAKALIKKLNKLILLEIHEPNYYFK